MSVATANVKFEINVPITTKSVQRYIPCTESRLFQVFVPKGLTDKKADKLTRRLLMILKSMERRSLLRKGKKTHLRDNGDSLEVITYNPVGK